MEHRHSFSTANLFAAFWTAQADFDIEEPSNRFDSLMIISPSNKEGNNMNNKYLLNGILGTFHGGRSKAQKKYNKNPRQIKILEPSKPI